jgi:hypothetical protein
MLMHIVQVKFVDIISTIVSTAMFEFYVLTRLL